MNTSFVRGPDDPEACIASETALQKRPRHPEGLLRGGCGEIAVRGVTGTVGEGHAGAGGACPQKSTPRRHDAAVRLDGPGRGDGRPRMAHPHAAARAGAGRSGRGMHQAHVRARLTHETFGSESQREDRGEHGRGPGFEEMTTPGPADRPSRSRAGYALLLPGMWVEVLPASRIVDTLDADQSLEGLPFMFQWQEVWLKRVESDLSARDLPAQSPRWGLA